MTRRLHRAFLVRAGLASALLVAWLGLQGVCLAQTPDAEPIPSSGEAGQTGIKPRDYFTRATDPMTAKLVDVVERYHLSEDNYYQKYRQGLFPAARSDLLYVLRLLPNHPRALHLIAYDPNVMMRTSEVIWYFERAIRMFPRSAFTYAQYGRYMIDHGAKNVGIDLLDESLRLDPKLLDARAWLAEATEADSTRSVR
ncbi:MAG: tetratricopeptide repeat protein [Hyphomicrobiales bacterium]